MGAALIILILCIFLSAIYAGFVYYINRYASCKRVHSKLTSIGLAKCAFDKRKVVSEKVNSPDQKELCTKEYGLTYNETNNTCSGDTCVLEGANYKETSDGKKCLIPLKFDYGDKYFITDDRKFKRLDSKC